jgi:hypothetical protein
MGKTRKRMLMKRDINAATSEDMKVNVKRMWIKSGK